MRRISAECLLKACLMIGRQAGRSPVASVNSAWLGSSTGVSL
ncbi:MAG: hypothetical protein O9306_10040 [Beijerinckiaceae bacterium]|nr:hypothetical protein [Beijerinckiaceae bacterium]